MSDSSQSTPCGRDGCGHNRACCRLDCPIVMIEARDGGWYWEPREEAQRQTREIAHA
jgi:hypothetical protein